MKVLKYTIVFLFVSLFLWVHIKTVSPILPSPLKEKYQLCKIDVLREPTLLNEFNDWIFTRWYPNKINVDYDTTLLRSYVEFTFTTLPDLIHKPIIQCKNKIPVDVLYKAHSLKAFVQINQPVDITMSFYRVGQGPGWEPIQITPEEVNNPIVLTQPLDTINKKDTQLENYPKIAWLSGDYGSTVFIFDKYNYSKELTIRIYDVYLE